MIRCAAGVLGLLLVLLAGAAVSGAAEMPAGPRLALTRVNEARSELVTVDPSGSNQYVVVDGHGPIQPFAISPSSWSADGNKLAFVGISDDGDFHFDIYVQAVDGGDVSLVPGTRSGTHPLLSPDGHTLAFTRAKPGKAGKKQNRGVEFAVWLADLGGGVVRRITPYRPHISDVASSFSPDGSTLLLTRTVGGAAPAVISFDLSRGRGTVIAPRASEAVYSPNGAQVAFERIPRQALRNRDSNSSYFTDLYVMMTKGSGVRRLTRTARISEVRPAWDPSGRRLAYLEVKGSIGEVSTPLMEGSLGEINADGTCRTAIPTTPEPRIVGAMWRPGPGREAGPISC